MTGAVEVSTSATPATAHSGTAACDHYHGNDLCTFGKCCKCGAPIDPALPRWREYPPTSAYWPEATS